MGRKSILFEIERNAGFLKTDSDKPPICPITLKRTTIEPSYHLRYEVLSGEELIAGFSNTEDRELFIEAKEEKE